jgi:hypothetical protein
MMYRSPFSSLRNIAFRLLIRGRWLFRDRERALFLIFAYICALVTRIDVESYLCERWRP